MNEAPILADFCKNGLLRFPARFAFPRIHTRTRSQRAGQNEILQGVKRVAGPAPTINYSPRRVTHMPACARPPWNRNSSFSNFSLKFQGQPIDYFPFKWAVANLGWPLLGYFWIWMNGLLRSDFHLISCKILKNRAIKSLSCCESYCVDFQDIPQYFQIICKIPGYSAKYRPFYRHIPLLEAKMQAYSTELGVLSKNPSKSWPLF